jgi:hypothetical protein
LSNLFKEGITRDQIITGLKNLKSNPVPSKITLDKPKVPKTISFEDNGNRVGVEDRIIVSPFKNVDETITFKEIPNSSCPSQQSEVK